MNTKTKKQPVRRYYLLAAILMPYGLISFPWGGGASLDHNTLVVSVAFIALAVASVIRARRNKREG